jgi:bifunctional non-homologous end joining protein LigD
MIIKSVALFFCEGGSDKEYGIQLIHDTISDTYSVKVQWGRRGSTLQSGMKSTGVSLSVAEKVYDKLYAEKVGKGYKEGIVSGTAYTPVVSVVSVDMGERFIPQLLNSISGDMLEQYLCDDAYGMQEKKDGKHVMSCYRDGCFTVYNKKGKQIGYPSCYKDALFDSCVLDGEAIGDVLHVFDLLELEGQDLRGKTYVERWHKLSLMSFGEAIHLVPLAIGYAAKKKLYDALVGGHKEGVVFKKLASLYTPGKSHSDMFKLKFYSTCSVRVCDGRVGKHSVGLEILDGTKWVGVGHVTIAPSVVLPSVGTVIEIRYLYAYEGGSLYQPTYLGLRDDVDENECVIGQLKYKSTED